MAFEEYCDITPFSFCSLHADGTALWASLHSLQTFMADALALLKPVEPNCTSLSSVTVNDHVKDWTWLHSTGSFTRSFCDMVPRNHLYKAFYTCSYLQLRYRMCCCGRVLCMESVSWNTDCEHCVHSCSSPSWAYPLWCFVTPCVFHVFSGTFPEVHIVLFHSLYIFCAIDIFVKLNVFLLHQTEILIE